MICRAWDKVRLGDCCSKIGSGATPRGGETVYQESGVSLIRSQNVHNGRFVTDGLAHLNDEQSNQLNGVAVQPNDILLNITGDSVARSCRVADEALPARVNQHVAIIRPKPEIFDARFVSYFLVSAFMQKTMLSLAGSGGTRKALTKEMIQRFAVPCPPRRVQERISDVLSSYDDLIEKNRRRIALLEEVARLLYREWFVHFRFPGHEHVKIMDGIPEGWSKGVVGDLFLTASGGTPSRQRPEFFGGDINWLKTQEMNNNFVFETDEKITEDALKNSAAKTFPENTVLVAMYGATIGQLCILAKPSASNQACCAFIPVFEKQDYLFCYCLMEHNRDVLRDRGQGAAQNNVSQQVIKNLPIIVPKRTLITNFNSSVARLFEQRRNLEAQISLLSKARDLLLPRLMNGEIAV